MNKNPKSPAKPVEKQRKSNDEKKIGGVTGKGFQPGKSGNPNGRPPLVRTLANLIREVGSEELSIKLENGNIEKITRIKAMIRAQYIAATKGSAPAAYFIAERGWGKVAQPIEITKESLVVMAQESGIENPLADPTLGFVINCITAERNN